MKELLLAHKKKLIAALLVLGVLGGYLQGSIPLGAAAQQIGALIGLVEAPAAPAPEAK